MKCLYCDKEIETFSIYNLLFEEDQLCLDCREALSYHHQKFKIDTLPVESFYDYNSLFKDVILQYKECYDEALKDIFLYKIEDYLKLKYFDYHILYVPSSKEKLDERGFNHLKGIYQRLNLKEVEGLKMKKQISQLAKNYTERQAMIDNYYFEGQKVNKLLIVDDIYTTGSTLKGVFKVMQEHANKIAAIVLAKT